MIKFDWLQILETFSLILSVTFYTSLKKYKLGLFVLITLLASITDILGANKNLFGWKNNYFLYNYYLIIYTPLLLGVFYKILNYKEGVKRLYWITGAFLWLLVILNFCFFQGRTDFNTYSEVLTTFVAVVLSLLVISKLFTDDDTTLNLLGNPYFWIAGGTLIFSIGSMVILGLQQFILLKHIQIQGKNVYRIIMPILDIALYGSYSYSFILCKKLTNRLSQS